MWFILVFIFCMKAYKCQKLFIAFGGSRIKLTETFILRTGVWWLFENNIDHGDDSQLLWYFYQQLHFSFFQNQNLF